MSMTISNHATDIVSRQILDGRRRFYKVLTKAPAWVKALEQEWPTGERLLGSMYGAWKEGWFEASGSLNECLAEGSVIEGGAIHTHAIKPPVVSGQVVVEVTIEPKDFIKAGFYESSFNMPFAQVHACFKRVYLSEDQFEKAYTQLESMPEPQRALDPGMQMIYHNYIQSPQWSISSVSSPVDDDDEDSPSGLIVKPQVGDLIKEVKSTPLGWFRTIVKR